MAIDTNLSKGAINFIIWYTKHTTSIQSNVRYYKGKHYFMDSERLTGRDGGILDLYDVYLSELF